MLPAGCRARLQRDAWTVPAIFRVLQEAGGVAETEMFRTFNMGIGYVFVVPADQVDAVLAPPGTDGAVAGDSAGPLVLGEIVAGERGVELV